jgi:uncharacterized membrane protein
MKDAVDRGLAVKQRLLTPQTPITTITFVFVGYALLGLTDAAWIGLGLATAALLTVPYMWLFRSVKGKLSPAGREAAQQWLGVREYLRNDPVLKDAPPNAVAMWGPYLAYAVAFDVTRIDLMVLPAKSPELVE